MRTPRSLLLLVGLLLTSLPVHAVEKPEEDTPRRPNIVWINAEDLSPWLGCYGDPVAKTPVIDALARRGLVYENAFATAPICAPSRSCLATGLYATTLGTPHLRCEVKIPGRVVPLATRLKQAGYFTTNTGKSDYNFDARGLWDAWSSRPAPWRARRAGQPFFSFITVGQTHEGPTNHEDRYRKAIAKLPPDSLHDPSSVRVPPFYPDTPEIRRILARLYDLVRVFDREVGRVLELLEEDGVADDTIVFVFSDHGNGLPRYKRWLRDSGLRVPLVVHVPERFSHLVPPGEGARPERLVSFVDFPATALSLAGLPVPDILQGRPFLGRKVAPPRRHVFGARDRADDMFELSRSISDGRYIYVRHFLPHLPEIQPGRIFSDQKSSLRELRRAHRAGELAGPTARIWEARKPIEELHDLQSDPHEIVNLADSPAHADVKKRLKARLKRWILEHRDGGFLPESEAQIRALEAGLTPYDIITDPDRFDLEATLEVALTVGDPETDPGRWVRALEHAESAVRHWAAVALHARGQPDASARAALKRGLDDASPLVAIACAEALVHAGELEPAMTRLGELVGDSRPWVALRAARTVALVGEKARPLVPVLRETITALRSPPGGRRVYRDFNYASFTGWALELALENCGAPYDFSAPRE